MSGAVDDSADILARCATTTPIGSLRASMTYLVSGSTTEPSYDFGGDALREAVSVNEWSIPVTANNGGNGARLCFWWGCASNVVAVNELSIPLTILQRAFVRQRLTGFRGSDKRKL